MRYTIFTCLLIYLNICCANSPDGIISSKSRSLANCGVMNTDYWSVIDNEAGMVWNNSGSIGMMAENKFLLQELGNYSIAATLPFRNNAFGISMNYFGFDLYSEKQVKLAYSMKLGKKLSAGIGLNYLHFSQAEEYQNLKFINFSAGIQMHITEKITLASHIYNPLLMDNDYTPTVFRLGGAFRFSKQFTAFLEIEKNTNSPAIYKSGLEYLPAKYLSCRIGIISKPAIVCFGAGLKLKYFDLDVSSQLHPVLGFSQQISFLIPFK